MNKICPTTSRGKDPNREDVADAFNDGYAMGYEQEEKYNEVLTKAAEIYKFANGYEKVIISDIFPIGDLLDKLKLTNNNDTRRERLACSNYSNKAMEEQK